MESYVIPQTEKFSYDTVEIPKVQAALEESGINHHWTEFYDGELKEFVCFYVSSTADIPSKFDMIYDNIRKRFPGVYVDIVPYDSFITPEKVVS